MHSSLFARYLHMLLHSCSIASSSLPQSWCQKWTCRSGELCTSHPLSPSWMPSALPSMDRSLPCLNKFFASVIVVIFSWLVIFRASPEVLSMWPCKTVSHIPVLVIYFFPIQPIKLKLGLQIGGRLLIATHLDQSNYLDNHKPEVVNKYNLIAFSTLPGLLEGPGRCAFFRVTSVFQRTHWM